MLFELNSEQPFDSRNNDSVSFEEHESEAHLKVANKSKEFSRVLLPFGPNDSRLPGSREVWDEFLRADPKKKSINGFEGLQAVSSAAEFIEESAAELFLSGLPLQAFRRDAFLYLLNDNESVQIVDCRNSQAPELSGLLPYRQVKQMALHGDLAYLLIGQLGTEKLKLIVVDVSDPHKPRELSRIELPDQTVHFFVSEDQLVVFSSSRGLTGRHFVHLFDITNDFQLLHRGSNSSLLLRSPIRYKEFLFSAGLKSGLDIIDFHDPLNTAVVASIDFSDKVKHFTRRGDVLFVLGERKRIYVVDIYDPLHPVLLNVVEQANYFAFLITVNHSFYYLTQNGYLRVYDSHPASVVTDTVFPGELLISETGKGLALLSDTQVSMPAPFTDVLILPGEINVADQLFWSGFLVVLTDDGLVQFFNRKKDASLELKASLKLPSAQRWLASSAHRLYVGGESTIDVITEDEPGEFVLSGQTELSGEGSWDGHVIDETLCVAAGAGGIVCFSVEEPDRLTRAPDWVIPRHLVSQLDVRQLASSGADRLMAAAGPAGLLSNLVGKNGQLRLDGFVDFSEPIYALTVLNDFGLVSNGTDVIVIDLRDRDSMQNLGEINFKGVTRFAAAPPDHWAGYVPEVGWSVIPAPRFVPPEETEPLVLMEPLTDSPESLHKRYHLKLFNDNGVIDMPGTMALSSWTDRSENGAANGLQ